LHEVSRDGKGLRKWRAVDSAENQKQVFIAAHEPLEIAAAISTFPQPRLCDRMGKWKSNDRIPTFPCSVYLSQNQKRKETQSRLLTSSFRLISALENASAPRP
jgi:hypothetical protein